MVSCFAPCCKTGHHGKKTHSFEPDSSVAQEWVKILKKIRSDKEFNPKNRSHKLCDLHFESDVIIKEDKFIINGELVKLPRTKWKWDKGAIPTIFLDLPSYRQIKLPKKRQVSNRGPNLIVKPPSKLQEIQTAIQSKTNWKTFPTSTGIKRMLQFSLGKEKIVEVNEDSTIKIYIKAQDVTEKILRKLPKILENLSLESEKVIALLDLISTFSFCTGIKGYEKVTDLKMGFKSNDIWYSTLCNKLGQELCCTPCKMIHPKLCKKLIANQKVKSKHLETKTKAKMEKISLRNLKKKLNTATRANTKLKMTIKRIEIHLKHANATSVETFLNNDGISRPFASAISHALKKAKSKSGKGIRYHMDWLLECLLLRIKSPRAYKHIRSSKILPLPHPSTLGRLISGQQCEFGYNKISLEGIKLEMKNKNQRDRQGTLIFDEIHLRETMDFNKSTKKFDGFIDYAEYSEELLNTKEKSTLADHALVLMYRPLTSNWVQPIAAFATKGAAKGNALQKIIIEAVIKLESIGAEVISVVADGAKTNKSFWKKLGMLLTRFSIHAVIHGISILSAMFLI